MATRGESNGSWLMFPDSSVHYVGKLRRTAVRVFAQIILSIVITAAWCGASEPAKKPDPKKSHSALMRGRELEKAGHRQDAIAQYTDAVQEDPSNAEAWRARGK